MKILITGGTGFIGNIVTPILAEHGHECIVLTRRDIQSTNNHIQYIKCDLQKDTDDTMSRIAEQIGKCDAILYMAAKIPVIGQKKETFSDALLSTLYPLVRFIQAFGTFTKKIIYLSSIDTIGIPPCDYYDENCPSIAYSPYGIAKLAGETYLKSFATANNIALISLRFSQVYGPNEPMVRIIPILINAVKTNTPFTLYGDGNEKRRFLYVRDAANAIECALQSSATGTYNIAGKSIDSVNDLCRIVQAVYATKLNLSHNSSVTNTFNNIPSIMRAQEELGFTPLYTLEMGIKEIKNAE